jgi:hypothetical protein
VADLICIVISFILLSIRIRQSLEPSKSLENIEYFGYTALGQSVMRK